jgi:hypothetical protein
VRAHELEAKLKLLKLGGMLHTLELRRGEAEEQPLGHVEFLALLDPARPKSSASSPVVQFSGLADGML